MKASISSLSPSNVAYERIKVAVEAIMPLLAPHAVPRFIAWAMDACNDLAAKCELTITNLTAHTLKDVFSMKSGRHTIVIRVVIRCEENSQFETWDFLFNNRVTH